MTRAWRGCHSCADGLRARHSRRVRRAQSPASVPRGRGRAGHRRRGPGQRLLRRHRSLDVGGGDASRSSRPAAALRLEVRRLPPRRTSGRRCAVRRRDGRRRSCPAVTASGSMAAERTDARVAAASRIWVEGRHDAELLELVWGDELREGGIVVEPLHGADHLVDAVDAFAPSADRRLGVLLDHLVPGSKERRLADQVSQPIVLVTGHPFVDVWAAVRPHVIGIDAWPDVPPRRAVERRSLPRPRHRCRNVLAATAQPCLLLRRSATRARRRRRATARLRVSAEPRPDSVPVCGLGDGTSADCIDRATGTWE